MSYAVQPLLSRASTVSCDLDGEVGRRAHAVIREWVLGAPAANPALLQMLRDRDQRPQRNLVPWAGEFAGKYVTHAVQLLRLTGDRTLRDHLTRFVREWTSLQTEDGYLGPWPTGDSLTNQVTQPGGARMATWDTWGHYHAMLGLLLWHELSGEEPALETASRIADLMCSRFLGADCSPALAETGSTEMNLAPVHSLCLLYRRRPEPRYLDLARQIAEVEFARCGPGGAYLAGNYLAAGLTDQPFWQTPKPRWESLHPIQGLAELHLLTGDPRYRQAFESLWHSMREGDRHNNGGFTSGEQATGDPCHQGAIETCCTVAWMAMSVDMLRLTGDSRVADELEFSLLNSGLGLISHSGRWVTYDTPQDGVRRASAHSIVFQAREGTPELNCCSVNGPRVLGLTAEWALMCDAGGDLFLNYYGPGTLRTTAGDTPFVIRQETDYPRESRTVLHIEPAEPVQGALHLRIPGWSEQTSLRLNGEDTGPVEAGTYHRIERTWQSGDTIELGFDFRLRAWAQKPWIGPCRDWEASWHVVPESGGMPRDFHEPVPIPPVSGDTPTVESVGGWIDLRRCFGHGVSTGWLFTEVESAGEGVLPVSFAANWLCAWHVNGQRIWAGDAGGFDGQVSMRLRQVELPVKPGLNHVAVRFLVHPNHPRWAATFGRGEIRKSGTATARLTSLYRGPLLLAFDTRYNPEVDIDLLPELHGPTLAWREVPAPGWQTPPWLLLEATASDGTMVRLCDFASAGAAGTSYRSWLPVAGVEPVPFAIGHPWRTCFTGASD